MMQLDSFLAQMLASGQQSQAADRRGQARMAYEDKVDARTRDRLEKDTAGREVFGGVGPDGKLMFGPDVPEGGTAFHLANMSAQGDPNMAQILAYGGSGGRSGKGSKYEMEPTRSIFNQETGQFEADPYDTGSLEPWQTDYLRNMGGRDQIGSTAEAMFNAAKAMGLGVGSREATQAAFQGMIGPEQMRDYNKDFGEITYDESRTNGKNYVDENDRFLNMDRFMTRGEAMRHMAEKYGIEGGPGAYYLDQLSPAAQKAIEEALQ